MFFASLSCAFLPAYYAVPTRGSSFKCLKCPSDAVACLGGRVVNPADTWWVHFPDGRPHSSAFELAGCTMARRLTTTTTAAMPPRYFLVSRIVVEVHVFEILCGFCRSTQPLSVGVYVLGEPCAVWTCKPALRSLHLLQLHRDQRTLRLCVSFVCVCCSSSYVHSHQTAHRRTAVWSSWCWR
jgi:hypothetical protein